MSKDSEGFILSMTVKQEAFEGPLDLLLHLIEKNKMSIYDIQIAPITNQYMAYIEDMENSSDASLENMSDFIVMAATLLYIKSKMLLPKPEKEEVEEDPREELVARLLEYKKMKHISAQLQEREKDAEKVFYRNIPIDLEGYTPQPITAEDVLEEVTMAEIYEIFKDIMKRQSLEGSQDHGIDDLIIQRDAYTIREKSRYILDLIEINGTIVFHTIFNSHTSKIEIIVTFMALLELVHKRQVNIYQERSLEDIWISGVKEDGKIKY